MAGRQDGYALGVDLGTSNTVAVLRHPDGRTRPLLVEGEPIVPSGVYADPTGRLHVGRDARRLAQADPDRYEPNPKRRVDEPTVLLGDREYAPADLLAALLRAVADAAVEAVGFLPPAVVTCPATWDDARRQVLTEALLRAGWPSAAEHTLSGPVPPGTRLLREPVAAARYYTQVLRRPVPVGAAVAVFDFGGGTLDVTVVRNQGADPWGDSGFSVVSCGGAADLGGLDLDAALVALVGERVADSHPEVWARLTDPHTTSQWRDQVQLWEHVRGAKEMLSRTTVAPVAVPGVETAVSLTRDDLEQLATPLLRRAVAVTREVVDAAGLAPADLAGLFLVGGSSRIPLVARLLHAELAVAPTVLEQPELPVAEGALTDLPAPRPGPTPAAPLPALVGPPPTAPTVPTPGSPAVPDAPPAGYPGLAATAPYPAPGPGTPVPPAGAHPPAWPPGYGVPGSPAVGDAPGHAPPGYGAAPGYSVGGPAPVGPGPARPRGRRGWWLTLGAVAALAGVVGAAVLYLTRDRYPDLEFHPLRTVARIAAGTERPVDMFTAVLDDRAYLAHPVPGGRLQVVAVDTGTGTVLWREQTTNAADRWARIEAAPGVVAAVADAPGSSTPRDLVVLDARTGKQRWHRQIQGEDEVFLGDSTAVLVDRVGHRLVGLHPQDGREVWSQASPQGSGGSTRTSVYRVTTDEATGGPAFPDGLPRNPWHGDEERLVQVGADRSVRIVDPADGAILDRRDNVADHDDLVVAHADRLYVAAVDRGYRLEAYDLGELGEPTVLYTAGEDRRPTALTACGEHRACLLEVPGYEGARTEVVAATEGAQTRRWSAPEAATLVPFGEHLLAGRTSPESAVTLFDPTGRAVLADRPGVAVRLDAGNLLVFANGLTTVESDRSVAGVWTESGTVTELGEVKDVRGTSCAWHTTVIACGAENDFVLYRFAGTP
ncbi:Hsp70 family protein [Micromonospora fluostatini]|uniref:Hsp70 family protein n=1 Tax=Micromonospora sp. JCM 30529 TaxID=3421643 RepID=UPI003D1642DB